MDEDEFNDFQSETPAQQPRNLPQHPDLPPPPPEHPTAQQPADSLLPDTILQPSFSMVTNIPSEQNEATESMRWDESAWPTLAKIQSDHLTQVDPMQVDFSKRQSEGEEKLEPADYPNLTEMTGVTNQIESNLSNAATLNSKRFEDFDFGSSASQPWQEEQIQPNFTLEKKEPDVFMMGDAFDAVPKKEHIFEAKEVSQEKADEDDDKFNEFTQGQKGNEEQEFVFEEAKLNIEVVEDLQIELNNMQPTIQQHSEDFVQGQINVAVETKQEENEQIVQENIESQQINGIESNAAQEEQKEQKAEEKSQVEQEDEDEFGDFQQTVPIAEPEPAPELPLIPQDHPPLQTDPVQNKVEVYPSKLPLGTNFSQKQKQLQLFVDSLPDYSFLLASGFNSL